MSVRRAVAIPEPEQGACLPPEGDSGELINCRDDERWTHSIDLVVDDDNRNALIIRARSVEIAIIVAAPYNCSLRCRVKLVRILLRNPLLIYQQCSASRASDQLYGAAGARLLAVSNVLESLLRVCKRIRCRTAPDPHANSERLISPSLWLTTPYEFACGYEGRRTLKLLHGEQAKRVAHD